MESYKTKITRLQALLDAHGICGKCGELYEHTYDEPFASCKCGCSEWYKLTPHMQLVQKLHAEIAELQRWKLEQLQTWDKVDTFARKYTRLGASVAAVALELMKRGVQLPIPAPAVPYGVDEEAANRIALAVYDCKNGINQEPLLYTINRILATEAHPLSAEGQRSLLQSAEVPS